MHKIWKKQLAAILGFVMAASLAVCGDGMEGEKEEMSQGEAFVEQTPAPDEAAAPEAMVEADWTIPVLPQNASTTNNGEFEGWGTSLCWWANRIAELGRLAEEEKRNLWMSEVDGDGTAGTYAQQMGSGLWLAQKIISDINELSPSAWVMWQVIDNHISEEGYNGNQDSGMVNTQGGFWGAAVADHDRVNIIKTRKYYAFGQFSRYIRPGYTIISCDPNALAAIDRESGRFVIVVLNTERENKTVRVDLSQFEKVGSTVKAVRTSGNFGDRGEEWAELPEFEADAGGFTAKLKANSITTYIIDGTSMD